MRRENKKRNKIIIGLIIMLLIMTVGYAAFQTNLNIKGTSKISSNWDIRITNVTSGNKTGNAENAKTPTWTNLTASMEANLYEKGDAMEYEVTVENKGTFDAKLEDIITNIKSNNEAIKISFSGYTKGEKLYKNTSKVVNVKIEYNKDYEGTPPTNSSEVEITLDYGQAEGGTITPTNDYLVTYDCKTNGGEDCSKYNEYLSEGSKIDLSYMAHKKDWTFAGWNTNKDATLGLSTIEMSNADVTLYAIYKKTINVSYTKGTGISAIGKTTDSCVMYNKATSCQITLPSITALTGYGVDGWYNSSNTKVGTEGTKVNVSPGTTLVAKGIGNTYTLTYNYNGATGGNSTTSKAVTYNSTYGTLPSPTRSYVVTYNYNSATGGNTTANATSNYTFNGWYKESTFTNQVTSSTIYNTVGNSTIYAKWTGTSIVLPTPTKTGYTFSGWYSDSSFTNKVGDGESSYTPTSSLTLYAKWTDTTAPTCTLTVPSATIDVVAIKAACTDVSDVTNYKFSENGSTYIDKGTSTSYTMNSFSISKIRIQATDGNGNTGTYQINATNLNDGYTKIYNVLNTKYKSILSQKESYENTFLDKTHPVGSIYVSTTYSTTSQVSAALGGTWEVYGSGKTLVGVNTSDTNFNTVNKTGGSSTSTLAVMNMPSHTHSIPALSGTAASAGTHTHSIPSLSGTTASAGTHTHSLATWVFNGYNQSGGINKYGMKYQKTGKQEIRTGVNSALENSWGINNAGAHTHTITTNASTSGSNGAHTHSVAINASTTGTSGSGTSFTNLQPYITVYMYKRVK